MVLHYFELREPLLGVKTVRLNNKYEGEIIRSSDDGLKQWIEIDTNITEKLTTLEKFA